MQIDLVLTNPKQLDIRQRDDGKRLVDLERIHLFQLHARILQRLGDRQRGRGGELGRLLRRIREAEDPRERGEVVQFEDFLRDEDHGRRAVGHGRRVGRREGPSGFGR